jgi:hypothetical protein
MSSRTVFRALITALVLAIGTGAGAQPRTGERGPGVRGHVYDPKTVETVAGDVVSVSRADGAGSGGGVHLVLRTDSGATLSVRLGPAWYVDKQAMKIAAGDRVEVKGSRVGAGGESAIVAAEVRKGQDRMLLRDAAGVPAWSGAGRRRRSP